MKGDKEAVSDATTHYPNVPADRFPIAARTPALPGPKADYPILPKDINYNQAYCKFLISMLENGVSYLNEIGKTSPRGASLKTSLELSTDLARQWMTDL